ncbi:MAG: hypothetical protein R3251_01645 [Candidatus Spechtbacterales bacterium]|nr:hypothetical protein [Candidatus Spechtbacterales bacterium]
MNIVTDWLSNDCLQIENIEAVEKYIEQEKFLEFIEEFLITYGYPLNDERRLVITLVEEKVDTTVYEHGIEAVGITTHMAVIDGFTKVRVKIFLFDVDNKPLFMRTLFHELDHVVWTFENKPFYMGLEYRKRPHEIRAKDTAKKWLEHYMPEEAKLLEKAIELDRKAHRLEEHKKKLLENLKSLNTVSIKSIKRLRAEMLHIRFKIANKKQEEIQNKVIALVKKLQS